MIKCRHSTLVFLSGTVWLMIGLFLMPLGIYLLLSSLNVNINDNGSYPLIKVLSPYVGGWEQTILVILCVGLLIGFFKGRFVLGKSARQGIQRIQQFSNPTSLNNIYSLKYYILIASMVCLGMGIKFFGIPNDIRGLVDVAIGAALINGALIYFRSAFELRAHEVRSKV